MPIVEAIHPKIPHGQQAPPCVMVIFGAAGDLTKRLLIPALYNLARTGLISDRFHLLGVDRGELGEEGFRAHLDQAMNEFVADKHYSQRLDTERWESLKRRIHFLSGDFTDPELYQTLATMLGGLELDQGTSGSVLFYLAVAARFFGGIVAHLGESGLTAERPGAWRRVIIEKPFGTDVETAKALNSLVRQHLAESQVYRMDHFLGKETVQNIMLMRFANGIFEPLWNRDHIDHVQITVAETVGVERRAAFYESTGALRDMVPNHVFQLLALTAMEPPSSLSADAVRNEKTKVLTSVQRLNPTRDVVRGQYGIGQREDRILRAYRDETGVAAESFTETYVAMKLAVDNWRWSGVPFFLRTGKAMSRRTSEIVVQFKRPPLSLFRETIIDELMPNALVLKLQPEEGASLMFGAKIPGPNLAIGQVHMDFQYKDYFQNAPSTGYETLVYDCMIGDPTLFQRSDSVIAGWDIVQPVLDHWKDQPAGALAHYAAGSDGPEESEAMLGREKRHWRRLSQTARSEADVRW
jgi:glucose-6-phosphate 1-dehydrogenase